MGKKNSAGLIQPLAILQGLFFALVLLIIVSLVLAVFVYFSGWPSNTGLLSVLTHLCVLGGAFWAGRKCERKAWLHGLAIGLLSFLLLALLGQGELMLLSWAWWGRLGRMLVVALLGGLLGNW